MVLVRRNNNRLNKYERGIRKKYFERKTNNRTKVLLQGQAKRLYALAVMTGYKRGQRQQHQQQSLLTIQGSFTKADASFYVGKKCTFVYRSKKMVKRPGSEKLTKGPYKAIWGKVIRIHGNSGAVRAKFAKNLPPVSIGKRIRIMLYPSKI